MAVGQPVSNAEVVGRAWEQEGKVGLQRRPVRTGIGTGGSESNHTASGTE